jgi:hypothetical protein
MFFSLTYRLKEWQNTPATIKAVLQKSATENDVFIKA